MASLNFDLALDARPQCSLRNVMAWRDVKSDVEPGAAVAFSRRYGTPDADPLTLGLFPGDGYNLPSQSPAGFSAYDLHFGSACRGTVSLVAVARPDAYRFPPVVRRFALKLT